MSGCGWIFQAFRSGHVVADDEVAVAYSQDNLAALTVPLINVRYWVERLRADGQVDRTTAQRMLARTRRLFYAERTQHHLRAEWEKTIGRSEVNRLLALTDGRITDVKAADAQLALLTTSRICARKPESGAKRRTVMNVSSKELSRRQPWAYRAARPRSNRRRFP